MELPEPPTTNEEIGIYPGVVVSGFIMFCFLERSVLLRVTGVVHIWVTAGCIPG